MARCKVEVENAHQQANTTLDEMKQVVDELMMDLPLDLLDDKTIRNLYDNLQQSVSGAQKGLNKVRIDNGIKIKRTMLSDADASAHLVDVTIGPHIEIATKSLHDINLELRNIPGLKDLNLTTTGREIIEETIANSLPNSKLVKAFLDDGAHIESLKKVLTRMTPTERLEALTSMQDNFSTNFQDIIEIIASIDPKHLTPAQAQKAINSLNDVEFKVSGALDTASMYARNPYADAVELSPEFLAMTESFTHSIDRKVIAEQYVEDKVQNLIKNQFGGITESIASKFLKSEVPGAQMFALNILETPSGFGGDIVRPNTASIRASMLHKRSIYNVNQAYSDMLDVIGQEQGWSTVQRKIMQEGNAKTHPEITKISEDVMIHINRLNNNKTSESPAYIQDFYKVMQKEYGDIHDRGIGNIEGITKKNKIENYTNQRYNDDRFVELTNSTSGKHGVTDLFRKALIGGGMDETIAGDVAGVVVNKKFNARHRVGKSNAILGEQQMKDLGPSLQDIVEGLSEGDMRPADIQKFVDLIQGAGDDAMPGYAHKRLNYDLEATHTINGQEVRMLDLMDKDLPGTFDRYSKEANGRIAIAEAMPALNSDAAINDFIFNTGKQAQLMGTNVDTKSMRNIVNVMLGLAPEGSLPMDMRRIRDAVSLAGMGGLGESQLAETGMAINRGISGLVGASQMMSGRKGRRGASRGVEITPEQMGNVKFLGELEEMTGLTQNAHLITRRNIHYDQMDSDYGVISKIIDKGTGGKYRNSMKAAQGQYTGYGAIRSMQDQTTMASLLQDINRASRGEKPFTSVKRFKDLGVDIENSNNVFFKNIEAHAIRNTDGTIKELNLHKWSQADRDSAGIVLNRHAGQTVQSGFTGEMSAMMENPWVAFMMQFKSYPILAAEKQQARHLKFADKEAATGIFLNAMSSSGARVIRYASLSAAQPLGDRQDYFNRQMSNLGASTFEYMGVAGMTPTLSRYATQLMGHPFGLGQGGHTVEGLQSEMPALSYANKIFQAHNSVTNGEAMNDNDFARIQSLLPLGTIGFLNILAGIFRTGLNQ